MQTAASMKRSLRNNRREWRAWTKLAREWGMELTFAGNAVTESPRVTVPWATRAVTLIQEPTVWKIPKEDLPPVYTQCGWAKPALVLMSDVVDAQVRALMREYSKQEWLAYLHADDNGVMVGLTIPEQEATSVTVVVTQPADASLRIDGVIHSHHQMNAGHSCTDDKYLLANHPVSIVASQPNGGDLRYEAWKSAKLPCGGTLNQQVDTRVVSPHQQEWLEQVRARIHQKSIIQIYDNHYMLGSD